MIRLSISRPRQSTSAPIQNSPDHGHVERCSGYAEPLAPARNCVIGREAFDAGKPATPPLPTACQAGRRRIETVEATEVALAGRKGDLMRAYNQNWIFDMSRPAAKTRDADSVSFVFCSRSRPAVVEPVRSGEGAGRLMMTFLVPEDGNFHNHANQLALAEYSDVCHARLFDSLASGGPAFARSLGYGSALGDARRLVDRPEDIFEFAN